MFVVVSNGYVYIKETVTDVDPDTGKKKYRQNIVEKLGRLDELLAKDPDAITKLKAQCAEESRALLLRGRDEPRIPTYIPVVDSIFSTTPYLLDRLWQGVFALDDCFEALGQKDPAVMTVKDNFKRMVYLKVTFVRSMRTEERWFEVSDDFGDEDYGEEYWDVRGVLQPHQEAIWAHMITAHARNMEGKRDAKPSKTRAGAGMIFSEFMAHVSRFFLKVLSKKLLDGVGANWSYSRIQDLLTSCCRVDIEFQHGELWCKVNARGWKEPGDLKKLWSVLGIKEKEGWISRKEFCQWLGIPASTDEELLGWEPGTITPEFLINLAEQQRKRWY